MVKILLEKSDLPIQIKIQYLLMNLASLDFLTTMNKTMWGGG